MLRPKDIGNPCCDGHRFVGDRSLHNEQDNEDTRNGATLTRIHIGQMDCPSEEALIRGKLAGMREVSSTKFDSIARTVIVQHEREALARILETIRALGFKPRVVKEGEPQGAVPGRQRVWLLALACIVAVLADAASLTAQPTWLVAGLAVVAIALSGLTIYRKGLIAIRRFDLNINALMSIAVTGALFIGQWAEAATVMVLFTIAEAIEAKSLQRARNAIADLMKLTPARATVRQTDGAWRECDVRDVAIGDMVRVKPGERIALDGEIVSGRSTVDQAPITGESMPVEKVPGDTVFAGTINETGSFELRVTSAARDTLLARIVHSVENAQGKKAPTQRFVDQFARIYTPAVVVAALGVALAPPLAFGADWSVWVYRALVLLVIACPCALVISTPVTVVSGLAAAARKGILVKGGMFLEGGRRLRWLALDKTGTVTHGKPRQTDFVLLDQSLDPRFTRALAVSLASRSDHPVSRAIAQAAAADVPRFEVDQFDAMPGYGVRGVVAERRFWLGNLRMIEDIGYGLDELRRRVDALESTGKTVVMLASEDDVLALFAVADTVKETSADAITQLHALGVRTALLTGDNTSTARAVARRVGIDRAEGGLLPDGKLRIIESLAASGSSVGMAGDGINDAPALARADIGFAMGAMGTDTAIETADVALMDDDLRKIPLFIRLSKATHAVLMQNIALSLGIKAVFIVLTLNGLGSMFLAVFADVGASLIVVGNGLRLLRGRFA